MRTILHLISDILTFFATITLVGTIFCAILGIWVPIHWDRVGMLFSIGAILLAIGHSIYYFLDKK